MPGARGHCARPGDRKVAGGGVGEDGDLWLSRRWAPLLRSDYISAGVQAWAPFRIGADQPAISAPVSARLSPNYQIAIGQLSKAAKLPGNIFA